MSAPFISLSPVLSGKGRYNLVLITEFEEAESRLKNLKHDTRCNPLMPLQHHFSGEFDSAEKISNMLSKNSWLFDVE